MGENVLPLSLFLPFSLVTVGRSWCSSTSIGSDVSCFSSSYLSCRANKTPFLCFCTLSPSPPPTFSAPAPKFARQDHRSHNFSLSSSSFVQNDFIKIERTTTRTLFHKEHLPQYRKLDNKRDLQGRNALVNLRSVSLADALGDPDDVALLKETTIRKG